MQQAKHVWKFFRAGGFDQVCIESGADLMNLDKLDQKLWVALACPVAGLEFDKTTLALIDTDKDGRIRAPELITAVKWAGNLLRNPDDLLKGARSLRVNAINPDVPEGKLIINFAQQVLGKSDADEITIEEVVFAAQTFASKPLNGDGILPPDSAGDAETKAVIRDIMACVGSDADVGGTRGVSQARVTQFLADCTAYSNWWKNVENNVDVLPLGLATPAASTAMRAVKLKIDDFFARCRLAAFDSRALYALNREEKEYLALAAKDLTISSAEVTAFPLARIEVGRPLPLKEALNPAWVVAIAAFRKDVVIPLLGDKSEITEAEWVELVTKLSPFETWTAGETNFSVSKLGLKRVREILAGNAAANLAALIAKDKGEEGNAKAVVALNRFMHYHRDLIQLCHNFVSFRDFYERKVKAVFQAGTLYLDQRSCDLCLTVEDPARHSLMAGLAGAYLAYCDCVRKGTSEKMQIVAAFTGGDSDNLMVGRNGVFYDRKGRDWDATITKIVDNPISIRQAFWTPYKKVVRKIDELIAKRAAAAETESVAKMETVASAAVLGDKTKLPTDRKKLDVGIVAALGVAAGTLTTTFGVFLGILQDMPFWKIPFVVLSIILLISTPSMLIAWLKLRRRNLGPILDANGWAVNAKAKMNVPFGGSLTKTAALPEGSERNIIDPFAEKRSPWPTIIGLLILLMIFASIADQNGKLYEWIGIGTEKKVGLKVTKELTNSTSKVTVESVPPASGAKSP